MLDTVKIKKNHFTEGGGRKDGLVCYKVNIWRTLMDGFRDMHSVNRPNDSPLFQMTPLHPLTISRLNHASRGKEFWDDRDFYLDFTAI